MTSKAALGKALLDGRTLNIKNGFSLLGITNLPREIGRCIERPFGLKVIRTPRQGTSRYGQACVWIDYYLPVHANENLEGIKLLKQYIKENSGEEIKLKYSKHQDQPKKQKTEMQQNLFL